MARHELVQVQLKQKAIFLTSVFPGKSNVRFPLKAHLPHMDIICGVVSMWSDAEDSISRIFFYTCMQTFEVLYLTLKSFRNISLCREGFLQLKWKSSDDFAHLIGTYHIPLLLTPWALTPFQCWKEEDESILWRYRPCYLCQLERNKSPPYL